MTMTMIECYGQCYGRNLIDAEGFCSPFVFCGDDGRIYVGDSDNLDSFATVDEAIARCNSYILSGERLERLPLTVVADAVELGVDTARLAGGPSVFFELSIE